MDCLGKLMYVEPMVENLDPKLIVTTSCRFFSLDLYTCQKTDAVFANLYSIKMEKSSGTVDGFVAWFDVEFRERLNSVVTFTTSPYHTSTHWK